MSYLAPLRLHFAGQFQAAPSTVNNDPTHFDNATFKPEYQQRQGEDSPNGWWNPRGNADWRLIGCKVTSAFAAEGTPVGTDDPVLACLVADSDTQVAGKLVDLDPEQQLVSEIWGLEVRICDAAGRTVVRGRFRTAAFMDIWDRASSGGGDIGACAAYQSVLTDLEWAEQIESPMLRQLREAATDGLLSIKFNVDGYTMDFDSPDFTRGRIVGTIGAARRAEPAHFVPGRRFLAERGTGGNFFAPLGGINFCTAVLDESRGKIYCDLGNSLPTTTPGGAVTDLGELSIVSVQDPSSPSHIAWVDYRTDPNWYENSAGVVELPAERRLTDTELATISTAPLALTLSSYPHGPAIAEPPHGVAVRADRYVFRMDPGDDEQVRLVATRYGRPYPGATIVLTDYPDELQAQVNPGWPSVDTPSSGLSYPSTVQADDHGVAKLPIGASNPGNPRGYIDGQVYGVYPALAETVGPGSTYPFDPWEFVSVLVADEFTPDDPPTWWGCLRPIFQQYANLYPVMDRFLDLGDYESVCANRELLLLAFELDTDDPNSMPVTRDLSGAKRKTIVRWLQKDGPQGRPLEGRPEEAPTRTPSSSTTTRPSVPLAGQGGKAAAAARRLSVRRAAEREATR